MRFFTSALVALATLGVAVFAAEGENPLTYPSSGDTIKAGQTVPIKWTPTTGTDEKITLILRSGESGNLDTIGPIVESTENDGEYEWTVPENLPAGSNYAIQIKWEGGDNYTPQFTVDSDVTAPTTTDATTTATETATETETETATETETETATETETETETTTTEESTTTEETTVTPTTLLTSIITPAPNNTITTSSTSTRSSPPRTTTSTDDEDDEGAPDPSGAAGLGKVISSGLVLLAGAAWALLL